MTTAVPLHHMHHLKDQTSCLPDHRSSAGFASVPCTCTEEPGSHWVSGRRGDWHDRCRALSLAPAVGSTGQQVWRIVAANSGALVPGAVVTLQNAAQAACGGYITATTARCGSGRVLLESEGNAAGARWMLRACPNPLSFMLESASHGYCHKRWLGAARSCSSNALALYANNDARAAVVWLVLPA